MKRQITVVALFLMVSTLSSGQVDVLGAVGSVADGAELVAIGADIVETTIYTKDKLTQLDRELKQIEAVLNSPQTLKYLSQRGRNKYLDQVRYKARQVQLYATLLRNTIRYLIRLQEQLVKAQAKGAIEGKVGDAIKSGIASALGSAAESFGLGGLVGSGGAEMKPVVDEIKKLNTDVTKQSLEEKLVQFLIQLDQFNRGIDDLVADISTISESLYSQLGFGMMYQMPFRTIYDYAKEKNIQPK